MLRLGCIPSLLASRVRGGRVPQLTHLLAPALAQALVVAVLGCGDDAQPPTSPEEPAAPMLTTGSISSGKTTFLT